MIKIGIALESADLTLKDLQPDERNDYSSDILKMKDGTSLVKEQVICMISSTSNLLDLLDRESEDSYFEWKNVVENLAQNLDSKESIC